MLNSHNLSQQLHQKSKGKQKGTVLVISLLLLSALTILVTSSVQESIVNQQISANTFKNQEAFQYAENANAYAMQYNNGDWIKETLFHIDTPSHQWPKYNIDFGVYGVSTSASLNAKRTYCQNSSINSDIRCSLLEIQSNAQIKGGRESGITQGFVRSGAG